MANSPTTGVATVPDPDVSELGPAMLACNPAQRRFAIAATQYPLAKDWQVAKAAGYSDRSHGALRVTAHRCFHDEKVLAAIKECADKDIRGTAVMGVAVLKKIARMDGHKDQLKAALGLVQLAGFTIDQNINVNQTVRDESSKGILKRIEALADRLGVPTAGLLGSPASNGTEKINMPVVDAEFSEVKDD